VVVIDWGSVHVATIVRIQIRTILVVAVDDRREADILRIYTKMFLNYLSAEQ
jgi:hypothetical protein